MISPEIEFISFLSVGHLKNQNIDSKGEYFYFDELSEAV